jgi:hypothetical protein
MRINWSIIAWTSPDLVPIKELVAPRVPSLTQLLARATEKPIRECGDEIDGSDG